MYVKQLSEDEKKALNQRFERIKELQEKGICFSCYNFTTGDTIGFGNFVREEGIIMDYHETVELYKYRLKEIIK